MSVAPLEYPGKKYRGRYAYDHQVEYWINTGVIVEKGYAIHHKNNNKHDNRFENLQLLTVKEHSKHHGSLSKVYRFAICPSCKKEFQQKKRPAQRFCSRKCIGLYNFPSRIAKMEGA